jgi:hypothetical protein
MTRLQLEVEEKKIKCEACAREGLSQKEHTREQEREKEKEVATGGRREM